jgi:uncharacterized membrane protein YcjF (UPF0283 family)
MERGGCAMRPRNERIIGLITAALGAVVVSVAVIVFGLTHTSNGEATVDWVSVITALGGLVIVGRGLYEVVHKA